MYTRSEQKKFSVLKSLRSFKFALNGIASFFEEEQNAWIHLFATCLVGGLILIVPCSTTEIILLVFAIGFVWASEIFNTAIERLADGFSKEYSPHIKFIKDLSAAAVLIAALSSLIIGSIIFIPKIF